MSPFGNGGPVGEGPVGVNSSFAEVTHRPVAGDPSWRHESVNSGHDSTSTKPQGNGETASLQLPISFPEGWLATQASELLAFSLHALEQQAAEEQVPFCIRAK